MAGEDPKYTAFLKEQPCHLAEHGGCIGAVHVHHAQGRKGLGTTNHDHTGKPLCWQHHINERHPLKGYFARWVKAQIREWEERTSAHYRRLYLGVEPHDDF